MLAGEAGEPRRWAMDHMLKVGGMFDAAGPRAGEPGAHDGRPGIARRGRCRLSRGAGRARPGRAPGAGADDHRSARRRSRALPPPRADRGHGRSGAADHRRLRGHGHPDDQHLHQLPDHPAAGPGRASGLRRHRCRHLFQQRLAAPSPTSRAVPRPWPPGSPGGPRATACHLAERRRGTKRFVVRHQPEGLLDWGILGGIVGRRSGSYWEVPVIEGIETAPTSDELKHCGAAMASFGSTPLFHLVGITPEAPSLAAVWDGPPPPAEEITTADVDALKAEFGGQGDKVDVVVFAAPQLSLIEMQRVADLVAGRTIHRQTALIVCTSPAVYADSRRLGLVEQIEGCGAQGARGHLLLQPVRPRDRRGQWLGAAALQLAQDRQHPGRLRLPASTRHHGGLRRIGRSRGRSSDDRPLLPQRHRPQGRGRPPWSPGTISRPATTSTGSTASSRDRSTSSPGSPTRTRSWSSTRPRAASPRPGCCTR